MRSWFKLTLFAILMFYLFTQTSFVMDWGFSGHKIINKKAIYLLPEGLFQFYKKHADYIIENAVTADIRKHSDPDEGVRHYIDIDYYAAPPLNPFDSVPPHWYDAVSKYTEDTLVKYGTVPWTVLRVYKELTNAFYEKDGDQIRRLSADLAHYIADAHVPLHTTLNYDGQLTGQDGIHAFWETRLVELYFSDPLFDYQEVKYVNDPNAAIWGYCRIQSSPPAEDIASRKNGKSLHSRRPAVYMDGEGEFG
jgi:hypothetical protein